MNVTAVVIVAIVAWAIVELVNGPRGKKRNKQEERQAEEMRQHIDALQERIEVLERIVTDEKYDLKKKFEDLENDRVA